MEKVELEIVIKASDMASETLKQIGNVALRSFPSSGLAFGGSSVVQDSGPGTPQQFPWPAFFSSLTAALVNSGISSVDDNYYRDISNGREPSNFGRWVVGMQEGLRNQIDPLFRYVADEQEEANFLREQIRAMGGEFGHYTEATQFGMRQAQTGYVLPNGIGLSQDEFSGLLSGRQAYQDRYAAMAIAYTGTEKDLPPEDVGYDPSFAAANIGLDDSTVSAVTNLLAILPSLNQELVSTSKMTEQVSASTGTWRDINVDFGVTMDEQLLKIQMMAQGVGDYQQEWDAALATVTQDGEVSSQELSGLVELHDDINASMGNVLDTTTQLSDQDLASWAAMLGENSLASSENIALLKQSFDDLFVSIQTLAESGFADDIAESFTSLYKSAYPQLAGMAGKAEGLKTTLEGMPSKVSSSAHIDIKKTGNASMDDLRFLWSISGKTSSGSAKYSPGESPTGGYQEQLATGGPLGDLALVGEEGPELIIDGIVVPTRETRKLMSLGLLPKRRYALGGPLGGGGAVFSPPQPEDFDPLNLEQRALLRGGGTRSAPDRSPSSRAGASSTGGRARTRQQAAAELAPTLQDLVEASLAPVVPQVTIAAAQAAGSVAPASITAANAQLSREMARNIEASNDRLARLMEQQILETRRMKTYFRDAVRLTTD